jgi:hypothetical protein
VLGDGLAVLGLVAPDLLAGEAERVGDVDLTDALGAGVGDGMAERQAALSDRLAGSQVGVSRF